MFNVKHPAEASVAENKNSNDNNTPICNYENSTYRTDFWEGQGREYEDLAERIALRRLIPPAGRRILDIGAGFGRLADLYAGYDQVVLLDYSQSQLAYARERLGDERFVYVAADIYRLPLATSAVDTTVMVRVLHHLVDVPRAFEQVQRAIRPQGTFVLEFANKRHLKNIARRLLGRGPNPFDRQPYEFADLHFDFHPAWVGIALHEAGFDPGPRRSVSLLRSGLLKRTFPARLLAALDGALQRVTAPLTPAPSVFVRSRCNKEGAGDLAPVEALFRCPDCGAEPLTPGQGALHCAACGKSWPIEDGIYVFK
jgi:SAM-dependent methyltransferase